MLAETEQTTAVAEAEAVPLILQMVPLDHVDAVIPHIVDRLASIADGSGGRLSLESLAGDLMTGSLQLWVITDDRIRGVVVTELVVYANGNKIASIRGATGESAVKWLHLIRDLEAWARAEGCTKLEAWARKGWARRLGDYKMSHVMLEKDLT